MDSGVLNNIMSAIYHIDPNIKYRQLNKQIYNETATTFYNTYSNLPIHKSEIINYIKTYPLKIGIVKLIYDTEWDYAYVGMAHHYLFKFTLFNTHDYPGNTNEFKIIASDGNNISILVNNIHHYYSPHIEDLINDVTLNQIMFYDLLTYYHIYNHRGDCIRVNKNYAKEKVIHELENHIKLDSFFNIFMTYQYMLLNCFAFDILNETYNEMKTMALYNIIDIPANRTNKDTFLIYLNESMNHPMNINLYNKQKEYMLHTIKKLKPQIENCIYQL